MDSVQTWDTLPEVTGTATAEPAADLKLCDCAGCGDELVGEASAAAVPRRLWERRKAVAGRLLDRSTGSLRPYCPACYAAAKRTRPAAAEAGR